MTSRQRFVVVMTISFFVFIAVLGLIYPVDPEVPAVDRPVRECVEDEYEIVMIEGRTGDLFSVCVHHEAVIFDTTIATAPTEGQ